MIDLTTQALSWVLGFGMGWALVAIVKGRKPPKGKHRATSKRRRHSPSGRGVFDD